MKNTEKIAGIREANLKQAILRQYRSIRSFSIDMGIPYSSIMSALDKGFSGMAFDTVMGICGKLGINPYDFGPINVETVNAVEQYPQQLQSIIKNYSKLNEEGRMRLAEISNDFTELRRYR